MLIIYYKTNVLQVQNMIHHIMHICHDLNFGLATKVGCGPKVQLENHIHSLESAKECEGMSLHTPKWTPTLGVRILTEYQIFKE
jgi:hypothetical protein